MNNSNNNYDDADHWVYPVKNCYQPYIVDLQLMSFFHAAAEYEKDDSFTREELKGLVVQFRADWHGRILNNKNATSFNRSGSTTTKMGSIRLHLGTCHGR